MAKEQINTVAGTRITRVYSAKFYYFKYVTEERNKWFNVFPLVFSLGKRGNIIQGLDFHYIPPNMRIPLLTMLRNLQPNLTKQPVAFARYFNKLMWTQRKWKPAQACFKKYTLDNIRGGKIIRIAPKDWDEVLLRPKIDKFVTQKGSKVASGRVWKDSIKYIRG